MLAGVPLEDVIGQISDTATTWREIRSALFQFGVVAEEKLQPAYYAGDTPPVAVVFLPTVAVELKHAVVVKDGDVYDPRYSEPYSAEEFQFAYGPAQDVIRFAKVTSSP